MKPRGRLAAFETEPPQDAPVAELPYGRHLIDETDIDAVLAVLRSDHLTTGPEIERFETALADHVGARHAVACSSGTAALHIAVVALGLQPGDIAIVPAISFLATANAVRLAGAHVAFADVDPNSGLMGPEHLLEASRGLPRDRVKAVLPVHLAGQCHAPDEIEAAASTLGLSVIEDAAHALGTTHPGPGGRRAFVGGCTNSAATIFSFHPVKTIAMGEGGAVTTNSDDIAQVLRLVRNHGVERDASRFSDRALGFDCDGNPEPWVYEMQMLGLNYRASAIHCALGRSQLGKLERFVARRAELVDAYDSALSRYAPAIATPVRRPYVEAGWHIYPVRIDFAALGRRRGSVMRALKADGVQTQVHYIPIYRQPYYQALYGERHLAGAERYYARTLTLPLHAGMTREDVEHVVAALAAHLGL